MRALIHQSERGKTARAKTSLMLKAPLVAGIAALGMGCQNCPISGGCDTNDEEYTMAQGETMNALTNGKIVTISVLDIGQRVEANALGQCESHGGWATMRVRVETEPAFEQEVVVSSNVCFSLFDSCLRISGASVGQDVALTDAGLYTGDGGTPSSGGCQVSNETVTFTLTTGR